LLIQVLFYLFKILSIFTQPLIWAAVLFGLSLGLWWWRHQAAAQWFMLAAVGWMVLVGWLPLPDALLLELEYRHPAPVDVAAGQLQAYTGVVVLRGSAERLKASDDTGDRKVGCATDHVARQYLGSVGKINNGIVAVTTLWADEARYYPLHVAPYTPAVRLPDGKHDAAFHTKPQIALSLVEQAQASGNAFGAIVADCYYGDNNALEAALLQQNRPQGTSAPRRRWARLGASRGRPFVQGCGALAAAPCVAARDSPLPGWPHRALVGRRAHAVRLWAGPAGARRVRHDRSA
jgi:hypothetical protein